MSMRGLGDGGAAHVRRRQAESVQRGAETRQEDARTARSTQGFSARSTFDAKATKPGGRLDGQATPPASSLLTEDARDTRVNCLDKAADWVSKTSPELRGRSELVFLADTRSGAEGQAGHVVVRQGERVFDPSSGKSYSDMQSYLKEQSQYREVGTLSGNTAAKLFATEPGSAERAQVLSQAKVSPALQKMMLADNAPIDGSVDPTNVIEHDVTVPGQKGSVTVELSSSLSKDVKREDGFVTVNVEAEMSATATNEWKLTKARVGFSANAGATAGTTLSYEVKMTEEDFAKLERGEIPPPHPLKAETIPDGATLEMEEGAFAGVVTSMGLEYRGVSLDTANSVTVGKGNSVEVSRKGDSLKVTAGPTEFVDTHAELSLGTDWLSVNTSSSTSLKEYSLRTAEFDLSDEGGKQAFETFAKDGTLPDKVGPGVSNTIRMDKLSWEGVRGKLGAQVGPFNFETEGITDSSEFLLTHNPDGTKTLAVSAVFGGDQPELTYVADYNKDGTLLSDTEKMSLVFDTKDDNARERLTFAFTGDHAAAKAARDSDEPLTLTLSASDIQELQNRVAATGSTTDLKPLLFDGTTPKGQGASMLNMARGLYGETGLADELCSLVMQTDEKPLPGQLA
ncbi:hypothetical protein MYSTI_02424 [Myxococcus stipitatus DSM 14675]|uniref:Uncharacterized protein n=1 Tax=Myxococcus stipitatus (strain DSM 14675 / JCM 12634 / Mx s8) TaxID=1278073 RepID=L7U7B5_MYXSD|nr:hypothetical protein [Myxococcus stipitatus]AGC43740.1 hypothetical protein MYSTI_02424 [Myxococcus stipitatus DSM 14675]